MGAARTGQKVAADFEADVAAVQGIAAVATMLEVICRTTNMGFAAVARVTDDNWIACGVRDEIAFGLKPGGELKIETTICREVCQRNAPVVIDDVATDDRYCDHPTPALYGFRSYISVPILLADGTVFGTLCAIDPKPNRLDKPETIGLFRMFAELIAFHLDAADQIARSKAIVQDERKTAELREQFIAVLAHDLRNPLTAIRSGVNILADHPAPDHAARVLTLMQGSINRMAALIDNVLDFARGRLGGGLPLRQEPIDLAQPLTQVSDELQASHPDRQVVLALALPDPIRCDGTRIAQLFSNLLGNALTHGAAEVPVQVQATIDGDMFELSVSNGGPILSREALDRLFKPFARGAVRQDQGGLGLGLYIASEIARAHGGTLEATSAAGETRFTFRMPCSQS
ncbi:MAG: histidine kinase [Sphingomonas bacterium]|nr:histidine kinase [Sphingomonas bacterium]